MILAVTAVVVLAVGIWFYSERFSVDNSGDAVTDVTMYKNSGCQCCTKWANHLEKNSFTVIEQPMHQLASIKAERNIPNSVQACHTAIVDRYVVEALKNKPFSLIKEFLRQLQN